MITTLTGPNDFLRTRELNQLVSTFTQQHGAMAVEKIDGDDANSDEIVSSLSALPFLTPNKLIILEQPSHQKQFVEQIEEQLTMPADTVDVVIVEPKLDRRSVYYKVLKSKTDFREFNAQDENSLRQWAVSYADDNGGKLSPANATKLINRVGNDQQLLSGELDKLMLYNPDISSENIELMTEAMPQSTIFELLDAAMSGNLVQTERIYREQRSLGVEVQQIMAMLSWQLHVLALIKSAGKRTPNEIASEGHISPFVVRKSYSLVSRLSFEQVKILIAEALTLDTRLKTESIDPDEALLFYLLTIKKET